MKRYYCALALGLIFTLAPLGGARAAPSGPGGLAPDLWVHLIEGPLPWALPEVPSADVDTIDLDSLTGPTVDSEITDALDSLDGDFDDYQSAVDGYADTLDTLRSSIDAPSEAGNFDPGLEPDDESTTLYDMADDLGASIGEFLSYLRVLRVTDINSSGAFFAMLFLALAWVFFVLVAKVVIAVASDIFGLLWKLWEGSPAIN